MSRDDVFYLFLASIPLSGLCAWWIAGPTWVGAGVLLCEGCWGIGILVYEHRRRRRPRRSRDE